VSRLAFSERTTNDSRKEEVSMTKLNPDSIPKSGKGSEAVRLSDSPLAIRRGNADPTDVNDAPNLDFGPRGDYENTLQPKGPIEENRRRRVTQQMT
jgi:hypothetical protein